MTWYERTGQLWPKKCLKSLCQFFFKFKVKFFKDNEIRIVWMLAWVYFKVFPTSIQLFNLPWLNQGSLNGSKDSPIHLKTTKTTILSPPQKKFFFFNFFYERYYHSQHNCKILGHGIDELVGYDPKNGSKWLKKGHFGSFFCAKFFGVT